MAYPQRRDWQPLGEIVLPRSTCESREVKLVSFTSLFLHFSLLVSKTTFFQVLFTRADLTICPSGVSSSIEIHAE